MREWHEEETEGLDFISRRVLQLLKDRELKLAPFSRGLGVRAPLTFGRKRK